MKTDPTHESPDLIDQRPADDPTRFNPKFGDPRVRPGITLPTELPPGWTLNADGSPEPPPEAPAAPHPPSLKAPTTPGVVTLPPVTITPAPAPAPTIAPGSHLGMLLALGLLVAFGAWKWSAS
jgi:hypothetical protein